MRELTMPVRAAALTSANSLDLPCWTIQRWTSLGRYEMCLPILLAGGP
jgi:hypothetical protein